MPRESTARNFAVTAVVAVACSLAVSLTVLGLRGRMEARQDIERMRAVLEAAGLYDPAVPVPYAFRRVEGRFVDLDTGAYVPEEQVDPTAFQAIPARRDVAGIDKRERYVRVWLVGDPERPDRVGLVVLPLRAQGWATLHAFVALDRDLVTIRGFTVYEHEETPGMGAEVDNAKWKARWPGKRVFDDQGRMVLRVVQGAKPVPHEVDGITGASLTTEGIQNMFTFWFGDLGYGRYLDRLREKGWTMVEPRARDVLLDPVFRKNPIALLILGICSALVVTKRLETALAMSASVLAVLACSSTIISAIRRHVGTSVRIFVQTTVIASLVIVVSEVLAAFFPDVRRQLSVFVGLIVTNCIVMGRAEGYALRHGPWRSFLDGVGNGLGYSVVLLAVATVRELLGYGTLLGVTVLRPAAEGGWYVPNGMMLLAPSAFFLIGLLIWVLRTLRPEQREEE